MVSSNARDQSKNRKWSRARDNGSYMFSVRIPEPLLTEFREFCETNHQSPTQVMRSALRVYMDSKVRRVMRRRVEKYDEIERKE